MAKKSAPKGPKKLTAQQRLFAAEYLVDRNATRAAIEAGYSARSAASIGSELLRKPEVAAHIEAKIAKLVEKTEVSVERVVRELHAILTVDPLLAFEDSGELKPLKEWPEDLRRALSGIDVGELFGPVDDEGHVGKIGELKKVRFWSKTDSARLLLQKLGALAPQKIQVEVSIVELVLGTQKPKDAGTSAAEAQV